MVRSPGAMGRAAREPPMTVSLDSLPYVVVVDGFPRDHFRVRTLEGRQAILRTYWFNVVASVRSADDVERVVLGRRAVLTWNVGPQPRAFYAVVAAARLRDRDGHLKVQLRLVPR